MVNVSPGLLGRDAEVATLVDALERGEPMVLTGEAGIGKTSLLVAAVAGRHAFVGGALGLLAFVPYLAIGRALGWKPDGEPGLVAREIVGRVSGAALVLDDLQWSDDATLDVLGRLVGLVPLLAAIRSGDEGAERALAALRGAGFRELRVGPLGEPAAVALARQRSNRLTAAQARQLIDHAGGNPLLITELARSGVSTSLALAIRHQLRPLDSQARHLLELLATAGSDVPLPAPHAGLGALVEAGLATRTARGAEIRHALIADVVTGDLSPSRLEGLHAELAELVADPAAKARHLARAGLRADAARLARKAADGSPPGLRAALLALAAENDDGPAAATRRLEAAEALVEAGRDAEAERLVADLPATGDDEEARRHVLLTIARWRLGDAEGAHRSIERAAAIVAGQGSELEARLLVEEAWIAAMERDGARSAAISKGAVEILGGLGKPAGRALHVHAIGLMLADTPEPEYWSLYERALADARATGDVAEEIAVQRHMIGTDEAMGRFDAGERRGEAVIRLARESGFVAAEHSVRASLVTLFNSAGDYPRVVAETEALLVEPIARRTRAEISGYCALALIDLGRYEDARELIDAELVRSIDDIGGRFDLLWAQADLALASGDLRRALEIARACVERFDGADYPDLVFVRIAGMWAALELGEDVGPVIDRHGPKLDLWSGVTPESAGIRDLAAGNALTAAERFAEAAAIYGQFHRRSEMRVRWAHGEALRRAGQPGAARTVLEAAEARATELLMAPQLARIRRSLRLAGVRRAAPRSTKGLLTGREREVLGLVADGLTNAQIAIRLGIGRPTVARLVASASSKLGATSRMQAALEAVDPAR